MGIASQLDRQLQVLRFRLVDDGFGQTQVFEDHGTPIWALRQDVKDAEKAAAGTVMSTITTRFLVRSTAFTRDVDPRDKLTCEGLVFDITGVKQASQYGRFQLIEWTAEARNDGM